MLAWFLCIHCERAFSAEIPDNAKKDEYENYYMDTPKQCPFKNCDGHVGDIWNWSNFRNTYYPNEYPEVPIFGEVYPLYPSKKSDKKLALN